MTKIKTFLLASAAVLAVAGTASAADIVRPAPARVVAPVPVFSWTGFYVGVQGGGGWSSTESDSPADFDISGPYIGAHIGADWQFSGLVLGIVADANWSGIHGERNCDCVGGITTQDLDWFGTVRGRLGFALGNWMPYITGGWAWGQGTRDNSNASGSVSVNVSGWTAGAGAAWAITNHWVASAEYKYLAFGSDFYDLPGTGFDPTVSMNTHTVQLGLSYKF